MLGLWLYGWLIVRPTLWRAKQVRNVAIFTVYGRYLEDFRQSHGSYPKKLDQIRPDMPEGFDGFDSWGHPILYLSDGELFVMVSSGNDGKPDGLNYLDARLQPVLENECCDDPTVDQVFSDRGWFRACGK